MRPVMNYLIRGGRVINPSTHFDKMADVYLRLGRVESILQPGAQAPGETHTVVDASGLVVCPGLVDIHVHLREPGQTHKEDIASGSLAAAMGGVTSLVCMPNTAPPADCAAVIAHIRESARTADLVKVHPAGAITQGLAGETLTDFAALREAGARALTDDGKPLKNDALMERAFLEAGRLSLPLLSHCEPETQQALRDVALAERTGCPVHICHVSRRETIDALRAAKARGVPVSAETCPHYFWFTDEDARRIGTNAKINPPLGSSEDREAVIQGLLDGTIDAISTDHAPHHPAEKALPFDRAPCGVIGLETLLPATLEALYHSKLMSLPNVLALLTSKPAAIASLPCGRLSPGQLADITIFDPDEPCLVQASLLHSKSANTPFDGMTLHGRVVHLFVDGKHRICNGRKNES